MTGASAGTAGPATVLRFGETARICTVATGWAVDACGGRRARCGYADALSRGGRPRRWSEEERALKKFLIAAVFGLAGLTAFAGTCVVTNISLTPIGTHDAFAGELQNGSGVNILQHNYVVAFLDSSNNVVEVKIVPGCLRSIRNGESDFFSATSSADTATTNVGLARLAFDSTFKVGDTAAGNVTVTVNSVIRNVNTLTISGNIKNNDTDTLVSPAACVAVFDTDGRVIIVAKVTVDDIANGANRNFSVDVDVPTDTAKADHVNVYVDGLDGSADANPINPAAVLNKSVNGCPTATNTATPVTNTSTATNTPDATMTATSTPTATMTPEGC